MKLTLPLLMFAILLSGCSKTIEVKNVVVSETITLPSKNETPHQIRIRVYGRIEGEALISLILNGSPYETEKLNGGIDFEWIRDWYYPKAILEYQHGTAKSGYLKIDYEIH